MATAALLIRWGEPLPGRAAEGLRLWGESIQYWQHLQETGQIESYEPVGLASESCDLRGLILVRGDQERLDQLRRGEEFIRLQQRAEALVANVAVAGAFLNEELGRRIVELEAALAHPAAR